MDEMIPKLLEIAESDLEASNTLYEKGFYPQSVYMLEQSVEKANKALGLFTGIIDSSQLKDVSHFSPDIFIRMMIAQKK